MNCRSLLVILTLLLLVPLEVLAQSRVRRNVEIEWEPVEGATGYEVQVVRKDDPKKKQLRFRSKDAKWSATIRPGEYDMQIRSYDDRGVPGSWSPPSSLLVRLPQVIPILPATNQVLLADDDDNDDAEFKWEPVPGAKSYKFKAHSASGSWNAEKEVADTKISLEVPAGEFINWEVTAVSSKDEAGEPWGTPQSFEMRGPPLAGPALEKPMNKYVKELTWKQPKYATSYNYDLYHFDKEKRKWVKVSSGRDYKDTKIDLDISRPSGTYRMQLQALADRRRPSKPITMQFETIGGFRDPAAMENAILRESIVKPTHFYAIASYFITQIDYAGKNYDSNTKPTFPALGGTGRIGLGYQIPTSNWGFFGIADLSGFVIEGQNFKFASLELHATRKLEFGQGGLLLFGTGLFSKELPIIEGTQADGFSGVGKVRGLGPHAGFTYWLPLNSRWGMQMNARAYYTVGGSTESGGGIESSLSYQ